MKRWVAGLATGCVLASMMIGSSGTHAQAASKRLACRDITREKKDFRLCRGLVTSRDGTVLLDTDVTLPGKGRGPFPLIVMLHGLGGSKESFECLGQPEYDGVVRCSKVAGTGGRYHMNNLWFASHGYAVLNYTARGFHADECVDASKPAIDHDPDLYPPSPACRLQLVHVGHEIADTRYLIGRLVDKTLLDDRDVSIAPKKIGAVGISYGGGHTWLLTRRAQWTSQRGVHIRLAAAVPIIGWTDLVDALLPNGRARDDVRQTTNPDLRAAEAAGVLKESYANRFYASLQLTSAETFALPGYLKTWYERFIQGESYGDVVVQDAVDKILRGRSAYYVSRIDEVPRNQLRKTPILAVQGFTDSIFPAIESLRMYERLGGQDYPMSLYFGDWGHPIAQNKADETAYIARLVNRWLGHYLKGKGGSPAGIVEARTTVCDDAMGTLYRGSSWSDLRSGEADHPALLSSATLNTPAGDPHAAAIDPDPVQPNAGDCRVTDTAVDSDNAAASVAVGDAGLTMIGLPEVTLTATPSMADMYVAARLWDVADDGTQTLVTRGVWRLGAAGVQNAAFQLFGNAYRFAPGHEIKLELTADDSGAFKVWEQNDLPEAATIDVSNVGLTIPLADPINEMPESSATAKEASAVGRVRIWPPAK